MSIATDAVAECAAFLGDMLSTGPQLKKDLIQAAQDAGFTAGTFYRAKKSMDVVEEYNADGFRVVQSRDLTRPDSARNEELAPVHGVSSVDKIARYGWTMVDEPGEFRLIDKDILTVDLDYQREETPGKVKAIAAEWSWLACGTLLVASRPDNSLRVFDGNHRAVAARSRSDIRELPCMVFRTENISEEAMGFLRSNTNRKPVTMFDRFRALVITKDEAALFVEELVLGSGFRFGRDCGPRSVTCVGTLYQAAKGHPGALKEIWPLVVEICEEAGVHERVVTSLVYIQSRVSKDGASLTQNPWKDRLLRMGRQGIVDATSKAASYYARGGAKVWASGVVDALNKGLRTNRLNIGDLSSKEEENS